jgi:alpha-tubulin suppressor-like RCC1 family protein
MLTGVTLAGCLALGLTLAPASATAAGEVVAWGQNEMDQLGGELPGQSDVPIAVAGVSGVTQVAAGAKYSLALLSNGTVLGWGGDEFGELGNGVHVAREAAPVAVSGLHEVAAISAGHKFSLALLRNGTVMSWGYNQYGKLGDGSNARMSDVPVQVQGLTHVVAISAGYFHALALLANGTVMAWGNGDYGELGNGATVDSDVPVQVSGLTGVTAIAAGAIHSIALLGNGTVMAWGGDEYGQLGLGETVTHRTDVPARVIGLSGVSAIAAGEFYNLALMGNGTVMSWGFNHSGQLGDGSEDHDPHGAPAAVRGLTGVRAVAASNSSANASRRSQHSVALLAGGGVMAWGGNEEGQLGDGSMLDSNVPVAVGGLSGVSAVTAGGFHDLALVAG